MKNKAIVGLALSMLIFGTIGIFRRYIPYPSGLIAMTRGFIGAAFLLLIILIGRKRFDLGAVKKNLLALIISGALIGFNWILLFEAYNYTSVATATLCYYTAPVFVTIVSPLVLKERLTAKKLVCIALSLFGMVAVSGLFDGGGESADLRGVLLGLGAALLYAAVVIINKKIVGVSAYEKTTVQLTSAAVVLLPYVLVFEDVGSVSIDSFAIIMLLLCGVLHTGIAYWLYFGSMGGLGAQTIAIFSYIDPVVAVILSATVLKERIGVWGYIGAILILGATLVSELSIGKNEDKKL